MGSYRGRSGYSDKGAEDLLLSGSDGSRDDWVVMPLADGSIFVSSMLPDVGAIICTSL